MVEFWTQIEADMQRYYQIAHPMRLSWRRFKALVFNLPPESALIRAVKADQDATPTPSGVLDFMDKQLGRAPAQQKRSGTLEGLK